MSVVRAYRLLLRLYPADYQAFFRAEMEQAFQRAVEARRKEGRRAVLRFLVAEFTGLCIGATAEWISKLTTDCSVRGRCLPDLRMMRPTAVSREVWFAGACLEASQSSQPAEVMEAQARVSMLIERMVRAIAHHDFPGARRYSDEERQARAELRRLQEKYNIDDSGMDRCS
ncbi:MAG TPA: hypothetical protein VKU19_31515 [Bryobacteraceae bacterium]|nr:hypothetical protein [Bryobacteraceae bacterium]